MPRDVVAPFSPCRPTPSPYPPARYLLLDTAGADNPTYLKQAGDKGATAVAYVLTGLCVLQMARGLTNMKYGEGKIDA